MIQIYSNMVVVALVVVTAINLLDFSLWVSCPMVRLLTCKRQLNHLQTVRPGANSSAVFDFVFSSVKSRSCEQHPLHRIVVRITFCVFTLQYACVRHQNLCHFKTDACLFHISCPMNSSHDEKQKTAFPQKDIQMLISILLSSLYLQSF